MVSLKLRSTANVPFRHFWFAHRCNYEIVRRRIPLPVALSLSERSCAQLMARHVMLMRQASTDSPAVWSRKKLSDKVFVVDY